MIGSGGSAMGRAGIAMLAQNQSLKSNFDAQSTYSTISKLPFSFKNAIDQIEDEILALMSEVSYGKKEVEILKTELETIGDVCGQVLNIRHRAIPRQRNFNLKGCSRQIARTLDRRVRAPCRLSFPGSPDKRRTRIVKDGLHWTPD